MNYQPSMSLRFVERKEQSNLTPDGKILPINISRTVSHNVLQQYWTDTYGRGEWRDIPIETEMSIDEFGIS